MTGCSFVRRRALLTFSLLCVVIVSGCDGQNSETVAVSGTITFNGGEWPAPGSLFFLIVEPADGFPKKSGSAEFGIDGRFGAKTFVDGDGLIPGRYKIGVNCWAGPYKMGGPPQKSHVSSKYRNAETSGFEVLVDAGDSDEILLNFDVPSKEMSLVPP